MDIYVEVLKVAALLILNFVKNISPKFPELAYTAINRNIREEKQKGKKENSLAYKHEWVVC